MHDRIIKKVSTVIGEFLDSRGFLRCPTEADMQYDWVHGPWMVSFIENSPEGLSQEETTDVIVSGVGKVSYGKMLLYLYNHDRTGLLHLRGPTYGPFLWREPLIPVLKALTEEDIMPLLVGISNAEPIIRYWAERGSDGS